MLSSDSVLTLLTAQLLLCSVSQTSNLNFNDRVTPVTVSYVVKRINLNHKLSETAYNLWQLSKVSLLASVNFGWIIIVFLFLSIFPNKILTPYSVIYLNRIIVFRLGYVKFWVAMSNCVIKLMC